MHIQHKTTNWWSNKHNEYIFSQARRGFHKHRTPRQLVQLHNEEKAGFKQRLSIIMPSFHPLLFSGAQSLMLVLVSSAAILARSYSVPVCQWLLTVAFDLNYFPHCFSAQVAVVLRPSLDSFQNPNQINFVDDWFPCRLELLSRYSIELHTSDGIYQHPSNDLGGSQRAW